MKAEFKTTCSGLVVAACFATCLAVHGQASPEAPKNKGQATETALPAFEVATIKPSGPNGLPISGFVSYPGGRVDLGAMTLKMLMRYAFDMPTSRISGGPDWVNRDTYDITALPPESSALRSVKQQLVNPNDEQKKMIQVLLIQRFNLKFHQESKEGPVFFLERNGKTLRLRQPEHPDRDARANVMTKSGGIVDGEAFGQNASMSYLAYMLGERSGRPVIDQTGISGHYDFHIDPIDPANTELMTGVIEAMDQLGFKLRSGKAPVETIVIDSVSRPSEN